MGAVTATLMPTTNGEKISRRNVTYAKDVGNLVIVLSMKEMEMPMTNAMTCTVYHMIGVMDTKNTIRGSLGR